MKVVIVGAGGQARVIYECLRHDKKIEVVAFIHNIKRDNDEIIPGIPVVGPHSVVPELIKEKEIKEFIIGVGDNKIRAFNFERFKEMGLVPLNAIHETSNLAYNVTLGKGVMVGMGATINTHSKIGNNTIINTGVIIEHDNIIEENVHIGPGTSIAGGVTVKKGTFIGIGCVLRDNLTIGEKVIIGAGSLVLEDIPDYATAVGRPAKVIKINEKSY